MHEEVTLYTVSERLAELAGRIEAIRNAVPYTTPWGNVLSIAVDAVNDEIQEIIIQCGDQWRKDQAEKEPRDAEGD